ncbi:ComEC/Rec2 family competence protein [Snodgrassella sp. CFCC 13594]|uniref:ComEC/Rec2 family competence protein n=1 Tax=Snodgrassella sp. CFCC 13594 TaxID=1775559 RepID=UPI00082D26E2|nr:ComEC/Rec2 family competence protein [Snodgrassella sp. CFCC 13594]
MNTLLRMPSLVWWVMGVCLSFLLPQPLLALWLVLASCIGMVALMWRRYFWLGWVALCLGLAFGVWRTERVLQQQWPMMDSPTAQTLILTVLTEPERDTHRVRFQAAAVSPNSSLHHRLIISDYQHQNWPLGSRWQVQARVRPMVGEVNPVGYRREAWALANHLSGSATVRQGRQALPPVSTLNLRWQQLRSQLGQTWQQQAAAYPQGVGLLQALSVGQQTALSAENWQVFRALGLTHLISISGLHVGMFALLMAGLVRWWLRWWPWGIARPLWWTKTSALLAALIYSALAGFAVPTQRSLLMIAVVVWALWRQHRYTMGQVWLLAMAAVLLFDPLAVLSVGFWLSFLLVAAVLLSMQGVLHLPKWRQFSRAQWATGIVSVVLLAYGFGSVPMVSPLANALAIPWFTLVLVPMALLCLLLPWSPLLTLVAWLAQQTLVVLQSAAEYAPMFSPVRAPLMLWLLSIPAVLLLLMPKGMPLKLWAWLILLLLLTIQYKGLVKGKLS